MFPLLGFPSVDFLLICLLLSFCLCDSPHFLSRALSGLNWISLRYLSLQSSSSSSLLHLGRFCSFVKFLLVDESLLLWISNYMSSKVWNEITYLYISLITYLYSQISTVSPKFGNWYVISTYTYNACSYLSMWSLKLMHVSKMGPRNAYYWWVNPTPPFSVIFAVFQNYQNTGIWHVS